MLLIIKHRVKIYYSINSESLYTMKQRIRNHQVGNTSIVVFYF